MSREGRAQPLLVQGGPRVAGGAGLRAGNRYPEGGTFAGPKHRSLGTTRFQGPSGPPAEGTAPATRADAHKGRAGDGSRHPGTQAREPAPARGGTARLLRLGTRGGRRSAERPSPPHPGVSRRWAGGGARAGRWEGAARDASWSCVCRASHPLYFGDSAREAWGRGLQGWMGVPTRRGHLGRFRRRGAPSSAWGGGELQGLRRGV